MYDLMLTKSKFTGSKDGITCIFDFDDTLKMLPDDPAQESAQVVNACGENNIALASASNYESYKKDFLLKWYPKEFGPVVDTPAFQNGSVDKSPELRTILDYYNAKPACAVLFDDAIDNKKYADQVGVKF